MDELLTKTFDRIAFYEPDSMVMGGVFEKQVEEILEPVRATVSEDDAEQVKELIYKASYHAELYGFKLGVRYMIQFQKEALEPLSERSE